MDITEKSIFVSRLPHIIKCSEGLSVFLKLLFFHNPLQNIEVIKLIQTLFIVMTRENKFHVSIQIYEKGSETDYTLVKHQICFMSSECRANL